MVQIPILSGIWADASPELRTSYPVNMVPVPKSSGINEGYMRPADGIVEFATGPGVDRGGINWNGSLYRVMGSKLVSVSSDGIVTTLGDVGTDGRPVTFDYSFDRLAIASDGNLFYWNGTALQQVTDADLGTVVDLIWVDGYFMTTDGEFIVVTDLGNPFDVNPLKYGSSEADPDPIVALLKLRNEVAALNRHTIEFFDNVGGDLFPFARIEGAQIEKGCIGTYACCILSDTIAFMGGGANEQVSIYAGANGNTTRIATHEVDTILAGYTDDELSLSVLESRKDGSHEFLYIHLPDRTLVYDVGASGELGQPVWFVLTSAVEVDTFEQYRARHIVYCYGKWIAGDPTTAKLGTFSKEVSSHYGGMVRWEIATILGYNEGAGVIIHDLELVSLSGSVTLGADPFVSTSYSLDGVAWTMPKTTSAGTTGQRGKRIMWFGQGTLQNWRTQRFQGTSDAHIAPIRLNMRVEPLAW